MDPLTIGFAVVALLGAKATEEFGTQAGSAAWQAVHRLGELVRSRVSPDGVRAVDAVATDDTPHPLDGLAEEVATIVATDAGFKDAVEKMVRNAEQDRRLANIVAVARDHAKQINQSGTIGTINM
ncbi:hypothetical protein J3R08_001735 [Micromonospora sp. HB375]|uniref:hypothetical protein n=1 Tax=unclassified Micromonospora TaxID=2617518 RepID=UPI001AE92065|nr:MULTISPECIES: hypothetical protein [unclassified Micromonospora]MBP1781885.1 hypothetical protein [Micromonospora sp. HB375]MDH6471243.1 hypothetical protein [Micromonospora sp. H404/HB375]